MQVHSSNRKHRANNVIAVLAVLAARSSECRCPCQRTAWLTAQHSIVVHASRAIDRSAIASPRQPLTNTLLCLSCLQTCMHLPETLPFPLLTSAASTVPPSIACSAQSVKDHTATFLSARRTSIRQLSTTAQLRPTFLSTMRTVIAPLLLAPLAALAAPDAFANFEPALEQLPTVFNETESLAQDGTLELLKRQGNTCANNYYACSNLGAPGLCCPRTAVCSADQRGQVACCPQGNVCTGTIGAIPTTSPTATQTGPFVVASTTTAGPFVQQTTGASAGSTVQNQFYPFPYIATTYTNAAACSSAYTSCQGDAAKCTNALANGAQGVTISAPNGGATITAIPSVGLQSAQSICASLSSIGCYQLTVEACARFDGAGAGNGAMRARCADYLMTAGVAVGIAGQLLR